MGLFCPIPDTRSDSRQFANSNGFVFLSPLMFGQSTLPLWLPKTDSHWVWRLGVPPFNLVAFNFRQLSWLRPAHRKGRPFVFNNIPGYHSSLLALLYFQQHTRIDLHFDYVVQSLTASDWQLTACREMGSFLVIVFYHPFFSTT